MPDLKNLLERPQDDREAKLLDELKTLRDRIQEISDDYDAGHINGQRFAVATAKVEAEISVVESRLAKITQKPTGILASPDPVAAFDAAPLMLRRATIASLCQVRIRQAPRGSRTFDPETVVIRWREYPEAADDDAALEHVPA